MDSILNPTIYIGTFEFREPITTLTDMLVSIVSFFGFVKFFRTQGRVKSIHYLFSLYFLCFGIGMFSAAWFGHGLQAYVGPEYKRIGWVFGATGLLFLGLVSYLIIHKFLHSRHSKIIIIIYILQYIAFVILLLTPRWSDFKIAQYSSIVSLIGFILPMHVFYFVKSKSFGSKIVIIAIIYSIIPGVVYNYQLSISEWFNYHDISHVLMSIFMSIMIIGTLKISINDKKL